MLKVSELEREFGTTLYRIEDLSINRRVAFIRAIERAKERARERTRERDNYILDSKQGLIDLARIDRLR